MPSYRDEDQQSSGVPGLTIRRAVLAGVALFALIFTIWFFKSITGYVELQEFHVWQGITGNVAVIDSPGYYMANFGKSWEYPKTIQKDWKGKEQAVRVTFNDNGKGEVATFVQLSLPTDKDKRLKLQEKFSGNPENILAAVNAHLTNCLKNSGPLMSASEHQAARKAEFTQVIDDQLRNGLYQMKRTRVQLADRVDENNKPVFVEANEIVKDDKGVPVRQAPSPLAEYGIIFNQFSITETEYDELSQAQFKAKQEAYLAAERSKAQREQEIAQKLMVIAQGERQEAEKTAEGNVKKAELEVAGQAKVAVAEQAKREAETVAAQKVSVAEQEKKAAETKAQQEAEVARIAAEQAAKVLLTQANAQKEASVLELESAKAKAAGIVALAEAKQKEIQLAGAVRETDKVLAEIQANRDVSVAQHLSQIAVPANILLQGGTNGTGATANGSSIDPFLFNVNLLRGAGLMNFDGKPIKAGLPPGVPPTTPTAATPAQSPTAATPSNDAK